MRLLIFSIQYAPEFTSNAIVITGLAQQLAAAGHHTTVLAGTPHYRLPAVPSGYLWRIFRREICQGVKVIRCWAFPHSQGKLFKFLNYATFTLTSLMAGLFAARPDAIIVVSPPFWLGCNALILRSARRCPVIYVAQDLFPDAYLASQELGPGRLVRLMDAVMTRIYRGSEKIVVVAESFAAAVAARGIDSGKVVCIPNFVDTAAVKPLPRANSFRVQHKIDNRFIIMYAGNIGYTHGTEILVEAAKRLAGVPDVLFLVIGGGSKQEDLERRARASCLENMEFLPTQPREILPEMLATADVFVITSKPDIGKTSFPSRIYNFLLAARPVIASFDEDSDLAHMLCSAEAGLVTPPGNAQSLCDALMKLYGDPAARARLGQNGSTYMACRYSSAAVVKQYEALLQSLTARRERA